MPMTHHLVFPFLLIFAAIYAPAPAPAVPPATNETNVHDLLPLYGLPRGLLPGNVVNYTRYDDGGFAVELSGACYVQFSELVYYERTVRGRISYGVISGVSGVQARKYFIWVTITRIAANEGDGTIQFDTGVASEKHPVSEFDDVRPCKKWASSSSSPGGRRPATPVAVAAA